MSSTEGRPAPRVLVVDDNRDVADSLVLLLELWGCEARAAYGGQEAVDAAVSFRPDCVLSDVSMPGMDGYQVAERLRRDERLKGVLLVAISAYADEARAKAAGFDRLMTKPADQLLIEGLVRRLHEMGKQLEQKEREVQAQQEVITEAVSLMKEVKEDVKEMKQELREVKEEVKEIKEELRERKGES